VNDLGVVAAATSRSSALLPSAPNIIPLLLSTMDAPTVVE
jgi:hypothetical protein